MGAESRRAALGAGDAVGLTEEQATRAFWMIDSKRAATRYLHLYPLACDGSAEALS